MTHATARKKSPTVNLKKKGSKQNKISANSETAEKKPVSKIVLNSRRTAAKDKIVSEKTKSAGASRTANTDSARGASKISAGKTKNSKAKSESQKVKTVVKKTPTPVAKTSEKQKAKKVAPKTVAVKSKTSKTVAPPRKTNSAVKKNKPIVTKTAPKTKKIAAKVSAEKQAKLISIAKEKAIPAKKIKTNAAARNTKAKKAETKISETKPKTQTPKAKSKNAKNLMPKIKSATAKIGKLQATILPKKSSAVKPSKSKVSNKKTAPIVANQKSPKTTTKKKAATNTKQKISDKKIAPSAKMKNSAVSVKTAKPKTPKIKFAADDKSTKKRAKIQTAAPQKVRAKSVVAEKKIVEKSPERAPIVEPKKTFRRLKMKPAISSSKIKKPLKSAQKNAVVEKTETIAPVVEEIKPRLSKPKNAKAKPIGSAVFRGKNELYDFKVFALNEKFEPIPAVYIISKRKIDRRKKGHHALVCIGQTDSIFDELKRHRKGKCVKKTEANVVSILPEADEKTRLQIETDLKAAHAVACSFE